MDWEMVNLVIGIRKALKSGDCYRRIEAEGYELSPKSNNVFYLNNGRVLCEEDEFIDFCRNEEIENVYLWKRGIREGLLCMWCDGRMSVFKPGYGSKNCVTWKETDCKIEKDSYLSYDNSSEFREVLNELIHLSRALNVSFWADDYFGKALAYLDGKENDEKAFSWLPLNLANRNIYMACRKADVFGGMGSWNDSTENVANSMGLGDEHTRLTLNLIRAVQTATLFVVNNS